MPFYPLICTHFPNSKLLSHSQTSVSMPCYVPQCFVLPPNLYHVYSAVHPFIHIISQVFVHPDLISANQISTRLSPMLAIIMLTFCYPYRIKYLDAHDDSLSIPGRVQVNLIKGIGHGTRYQCNTTRALTVSSEQTWGRGGRVGGVGEWEGGACQVRHGHQHSALLKAHTRNSCMPNVSSGGQQVKARTAWECP